MQGHIALHIHGNIALNGCECIVLNQHYGWCLIWWARLSGTKSSKRKYVSGNSKQR